MTLEDGRRIMSGFDSQFEWMQKTWLHRLFRSWLADQVTMLVLNDEGYEESAERGVGAGV